MCPAGLLGPGAQRLGEACGALESPPLDDLIGVSVGNPDGFPRTDATGRDPDWRDGTTLAATEPYSGHVIVAAQAAEDPWLSSAKLVR